VKLDASSLPGAIGKAVREFVKGLDRQQRFDMNKNGLEIAAKYRLPSLAGKFECITRWRRAWCTKTELGDRADSETPRKVPHAECVLHWTGCSQ
jgi:hypothetical protein